MIMIWTNEGFKKRNDGYGEQKCFDKFYRVDYSGGWIMECISSEAFTFRVQ